MRPHCVASAVVLGLLVASEGSATVVAGPCAYEANQHMYYLLAPASWTDSETEAVALGGHLVAINDEGENDWVWSTFQPIGAGHGDQGNLWIGFSDAANEGTWVWSNGDPVTWQHWAPFEPNNVNGENYAHMVGAGFQGHQSGYWNDILDSGDGGGGLVTPPRGVVEVVLNPAGVETPALPQATPATWGGLKSRFQSTGGVR